MNSGGLHPLIALPTRITPTSATLIDNIFTNDFCRPISSGLVYTSISDHLPAFAIFGDTESHPEGVSQFTLKREMKIRNKERFRIWLKEWSRTVTVGIDSVAEDAIRFKNEFRDGYNRFFPQRRVRIKKIDLRKPWLDDDTLKEKIKERNRLYALKLRGEIEQVPDGSDRLRSLTLEVGQLRRQLKKSYFAEQLSRAGKN